MRSRSVHVIPENDVRSLDGFVAGLESLIKNHVKDHYDIENLHISLSLDQEETPLSRAGNLKISFKMKEPIILERPLSVVYCNGFWYGTVVLPEQPRSIVIKRSDEGSFLNEYLDSLLSEISSALDFIASQLDWSIAPEDRFN